GCPAPGVAPCRMPLDGWPYPGGGEARRLGGATSRDAPSAGLVFVPGGGGPPGLPRSRSNGEGETPRGGPAGVGFTPGDGLPPGLPRSNGEGETAAGDLTVAAGGT